MSNKIQHQVYDGLADSGYSDEMSAVGINSASDINKKSVQLLIDRYCGADGNLNVNSAQSTEHFDTGYIFGWAMGVIGAKHLLGGK